MAATLDMTSFDAALKEHYNGQRVKIMSYQDHDFLALVPKYTKFTGRNYPLPIQFATPQGRSVDIATAITNQKSGEYREFLLTRVHDYGVASIDNETMMASADDKGAFMKAATVEVDGILIALANSLSAALFGDGSGSIGVASAVAGSTITLANTEDIVHFEVGMTLVHAATATGALTAGVDVVAAVNRDTGVLTTVAAATTAVNEFIFVQGDAQNGGTAKKLSGLSAWLPATAPGATAFFGVNRSLDATRLGGLRIDGSALTIEEALIKGAHRVKREGGRASHAILNPEKVADLVNSLGSKVEYEKNQATDADIGFDVIRLRTPTGIVKVISDRDCPVNTCFMLQMDTWKLYSLGECPQMLDSDGNKWLRNATADSVQVRTGYYAQLGCTAPGYNARITLS